MSEISPEAQTLIDRLARMDPANPRQDRAAVEWAINSYLAALGLPGRPVVWADSAMAGYSLIIDRISAAAWDAGRTAGSTAAWHAAWNAPKDAARDAALAAARATAQEAARGKVWETARVVAGHAAKVAAREAIWAAVWHAARPTTKGQIWEMARDADWAVAGDKAKNEVGYAAKIAVRKADYAAAIGAIRAIREVNGLAAFDHPAIARLVDIWLPLLDAFVAGLFLYWVTQRDVICVLQPSCLIENRRLHRANGPAVAWPSGEAYHFWHGVQVPAWVVEEKDQITIEAIRGEPNQEIRRCMTEIYRRSRYLGDSGARLVHEDEFGRLWEAEGSEGERWRFIEVEDGTPEPDGTRRTYTLDVTGAAEFLGWPIETARAAVAATYGLRPEEYRPEVRT